MPSLRGIADSFLLVTPIIPWLLLAVGFSLVEGFFNKNGQPVGWRVRARNLGCGFVICCISFVTFPAARLLSHALGHAGDGLIGIHPFPQFPAISLALSMMVFLIVRDFFFYVWHRLEHHIPVLWDIHAVHHSEEALNGTSYMRQNWIDSILQTLFVHLPANLLLGLTPEALYGSYLVSMLWNFFAHSSLRLEMDVLTPVLTGPQLHRLHHSTLQPHLNKNFAQFFPFWDILFGTYVPPQRGEFPTTGLGGGERIESVWLMAIWPLRQWVRRLG